MPLRIRRNIPEIASRFLSLSLALLMMVLPIQIVCAEEPGAESARIEAQEVAALPVSGGLTVDAVWKELKAQLDAENLERVTDQVNQLIAARDRSGATDLPEYAALLLDRGEKLLISDKVDEARPFYRWGYRLAPNSPEVLWRVIPLASRFAIESPLYLARRAVSVSLFSPLRVLVAIQRSISPLLLAVSWALFLSLVLVISAHIIAIFRVLAWYIPHDRRGWAVPGVFLLVFVTPLFAGMLWCLALWAVALYVLTPERRFFSLLGAVVVFAWGVLVPVSENIATWLQDPHVRRVVLAGEQPLTEGEIDLLINKMSDWSSDSVVQLKFAQLLRRAGLHQQARHVLDKLEGEQGHEGWIDAERGILTFLEGDSIGAEKLLRSALEIEGESAEVLFNLSRVVFELNNTKESRELAGRALHKNKNRVETYRVREEILGNRDPRSFADVDLPLREYFTAALMPSAISFDSAHKVINRWMPGMEPRMVTLVGILLVLMHLIPHQRSRRINPKGLFDGYEPGTISHLVINLVPGGFLILAGRMRAGFALMCLLVLFAMPLISGAYREGHELSTIVWFMPYHICILLLVYLVLMLCSLNRKEG